MNNQYQQPNQPNRQVPPPYIPPQTPRIDPAAAKKQKTDAVNNLGDKIASALKADPILAFLEKNSETFSYIATGACAFLSVVLMTAGSFRIPLGVISVIFGFFAISKKKLLPLTVAMSTVSLFSLICFIHSIAYIVQTVKYSFFGSAVGGAVLGMFFSLLELAAVGFLTYIVWTYFLATQPPKAAPVQQPYYGQQPQQPQQYGQPVQPVQQTPVQQAPVQTVQPVQPSQPVQSVQPVLDPIVSAQPASVSAAAPEPAPSSAVAVADPAPSEKPAGHKFCIACGTENSAEAAFCRQCGNKF